MQESWKHYSFQMTHVSICSDSTCFLIVEYILFKYLYVSAIVCRLGVPYLLHICIFTFFSLRMWFHRSFRADDWLLYVVSIISHFQALSWVDVFFFPFVWDDQVLSSFRLTVQFLIALVVLLLVECLPGVGRWKLVADYVNMY